MYIKNKSINTLLQKLKINSIKLYNHSVKYLKQEHSILKQNKIQLLF